MPYITQLDYNDLLDIVIRIDGDISFSADRQTCQIYRNVKKGRNTIRLTQTFKASGHYTNTWGLGYLYTQV